MFYRFRLQMDVFYQKGIAKCPRCYSYVVELINETVQLCFDSARVHVLFIIASRFNIMTPEM